MATRAEQIRRKQMADEARQRLKSGVRPQAASTINPRTEAVRNYQPPESEISAPTTTPSSNPDIGTPMAQLQQKFGSATTPLYKINANIATQLEQRKKDSMYNPAKELEKLKNPIQPKAAEPKAQVTAPFGTPEYDLQILNATRENLGFSKDFRFSETEYEKRMRRLENAPPGIKQFGELVTELAYGNPAGRFVMNALPSDPRVVNRESTGNQTADKVANVLNAVTTPLLTPSGAPIGGGQIAAPYNAMDSLIAASPKLQNAESAVARAVTTGTRGKINPQTAQRMTREVMREGAAGAIQGPAALLMTDQPTNSELAEAAAFGALTGGAVAGALPLIGQPIRTALSNRRAAGQAITQGIESADAPLTGSRAARNVDMPVTSASETVAGDITAAPRRTRTPQATERGFATTLKQSDNAAPELKASLRSEYTPITNLDALDAANRRIGNMGVDAAEAQLLTKKKYTAEDVATGMRLIQELQSSGNVQRAVTVADRLATELTNAGQTVQAASIWNRLSPEGALLAAQRKIQRVNEGLLKGQTPVKMTEQQANTITETAQTIQRSGLSQERAGTVSEIMERVRKGEQITPAEKQEVLEFVQDAKKFLGTTRAKTPKQASVPKEMKDSRVRDRVVSFLEEQEQAALERIKARRGRMNSLPLDEWADYAIVGATKLAKGTIKFADWSEQMVRDLGDNVQPYLSAIYEKSKEMQTQSVKKINEQVISRAERIAESYIKRNEGKLAESDINFVQNLARKVSDLSGQEQRLASQDLQAVIQSFEKAGIGRKLQAAQYIAMLLNPLTQIRNVVGNEMLYRFERIQRVIATPIDIAASKITGGPRTVTFKKGPSVWENFFQPTQDFLSNLGEGMRSGWRGVSPEGLTSKYEIHGQAFRSKYNPMTYLEKSLGAVLQGFDFAAYQRAVNQRLSEMAYLDALNKGIKGNDAIRQHMQMVMTNIDDEIHIIARDYGKFVTLQNDSALAKAITGFRRGANKITTGSTDFGLGSVVVPFAKTPANLLLRGLDYSPAGVLKAFKQMYDVLRDPATDLTRADVIESVSRSLFGTGIGIMAYWLADKGVIWGKSEKDPEVRKLMQSSGIKDFQINGSAVMRMVEVALTGGDVDQAAKMQPGDTLWAYEWAQPASMPLAIGSNVYQGVKEDKGAAKTTADAAFAAVNTLLDSSVLSSIREVFQIPQNSENPFKDVAMNLAKQVPSQFVPSIVRQINTLQDDTVRETYAMKNDVLGQITNYAESTVPGLAQQLPQRVSTLGEPQTKLNTFLDVFVSPAQRSQYKPTPEAQLVIDLINETGDNSIAPRAVSKYISGVDKATGERKRVDLTPEQYVELQRIVGEATAEGLKKINPDWSTENKVTRIIKILDEAGKKGRNQFKREFGLKVTK